jgi:hypothetical protein
MQASPEPRLVWLYQAALICQAFPAYRLEDVRQLPGPQLRDLLTAVQLLDTARKVHSG